MKVLVSPIIKNRPDMRFKNNVGEYLNVNEVTLNEDGKVVSVTYTDTEGEHSLLKEDISLFKEFLHVEGYGYIPEFSVVNYKNTEYTLLFGWHTNSSNQEIYSWYLYKEDEIPKTLYKEMIKEINIITFIN